MIAGFEFFFITVSFETSPSATVSEEISLDAVGGGVIDAGGAVEGGVGETGTDVGEVEVVDASDGLVPGVFGGDNVRGEVDSLADMNGESMYMSSSEYLSIGSFEGAVDGGGAGSVNGDGTNGFVLIDT